MKAFQLRGGCSVNSTNTPQAVGTVLRRRHSHSDSSSVASCGSMSVATTSAATASAALQRRFSHNKYSTADRGASCFGMQKLAPLTAVSAQIPVEVRDTTIVAVTVHI